MSLISIIIPVYNTEKYLTRCLEAILAQTYTKWEAIIVDDGSKDLSGVICDEYATKDSRFRVFHKENGGVSTARNLALQHVKGEYLLFVDSDDEISEDCLSVIHETLQKTDADMLTFGMKLVESSRVSYVEPTVIELLNKEQIGRHFFPDIVSEKPCFGYMCNKVFRASIVHVNNIHFQPFHVMEDTLFVIDYLKQSRRYVQIANPLYIYYIDNVGNSRVKFFEDRLNILEVIYNSFRAIESLFKIIGVR